MKYTDINIPGVFVTHKQENKPSFDVEIVVNAIGEIVIYVDMEGMEDEDGIQDMYINNHKILERDELKNIIDGLTKIYEGTE